MKTIVFDFAGNFFHEIRGQPPILGISDLENSKGIKADYFIGDKYFTSLKKTQLRRQLKVLRLVV